MGVISESAIWEDSVLQIEVGDSVGGGAGAVANLQAQDLANRTKFLKGKVDLLLAKSPVGALVTMPIDDVPVHCLECDGAEISRGTYSELFTAIGTTYGAGDGSTTFNLPDFRDRFLRGAGGANAAAIGTGQGDAIRNITGYVSPVCFYSNESVYGQSGALSAGVSLYGTNTSSGSTSQAKQLDFSASASVPTAPENRPVNFAVKFCIVYE